MDSGDKPIPIQTFKRLPEYYNLLVKLEKEGVLNVSSTMIAGMMNIKDIVVRKDFAAVSDSAGKPRTGFQLCELMRSIGNCLGYYNANDAVLVGAGNMGRALLSYEGFNEYGFRILAGFDTDENVIGLEKGGHPIMALSRLAEFCRRLNIRIGIITVPVREAQSVCDILVESGVIAIWNFAPTHLTVPPDVFVHNENMARSLSLLTQHLPQGNEDSQS